MSFCVKFCRFVGNSYPHTHLPIFVDLSKYLNISPNGLILLRVGAYPSFSLCQVLSRPIHPENENAVFGNDVIFSSSPSCLSQRY